MQIEHRLRQARLRLVIGPNLDLLARNLAEPFGFDNIDERAHTVAIPFDIGAKPLQRRRIGRKHAVGKA